MMGVDHEKIEAGRADDFGAIGEDPDREGLVDTPKRVARMYEEIFPDSSQDPDDHFSVIFSEDHEELVLGEGYSVFLHM